MPGATEELSLTSNSGVSKTLAWPALSQLSLSAVSEGLHLPPKGPQSNSETEVSEAPLHLELLWHPDSEPAEVAKIDGLAGAEDPEPPRPGLFLCPSLSGRFA